MNEDRYSQFIPDQQAGSEKTQEDNQGPSMPYDFLAPGHFSLGAR
jgi:hypothetical protein